MPILARKRFSQNFLTNTATIQKIVATIAPNINDNLVEIGPGRGAITKPILALIPHLNVVEIDRDLISLLQTEFTNNLTIYEGDALKFDFSKLYEPNRPLRVIGNLPYNISTPLIFHLLEFFPLIKDLNFMLQEEVVDRINAQPHTKEYGRLSVMIQYFCAVEKLIKVAPSDFYPQPKVTSAFVRLTPHQHILHPAQNLQLFKTMVNTAFSQRRKTITNSLKAYINAEILSQAQLNPKMRAENLSVNDFVHLSNLVNIANLLN